jgi:hypothetical protein
MNQQNYKQKYLKYKQKYLNLKNEIGGWEVRHPYEKKVPEFENDTNPQYINSAERNLNTININGVDASSNHYETIKTNIEHNISNHNIKRESIPNKAEFDEFVSLLGANSDKIIEIEGFTNVYENYKEKQDIGTYVDESDIGVIFKSTSIPNIPIKTKKVNDAEQKGFFASDGVGKKHLNQRMIEYKAKGVKYVMLEAAGGSRLVDLYKEYGFTLLSNGYEHVAYGFPQQSSTSLMFANIDTIIANTN